MRIKLTEEQYNRLLVENEKDFLDGQVNFKHIGNKVNPFIVKLFTIIYNKCNKCDYARVMKMIKNDFSLTEAESHLLSYNYHQFLLKDGTGNFNHFLGEPLEYYGKFVFDTPVPVYGTVWGYIAGVAEGYATSYEDFIDQLRDGMFDVSADWRHNVEADTYDVDWELEDDHANEKIVDDVADYDEDEIMDRITIG
jgi:hypothetical protein